MFLRLATGLIPKNEKYFFDPKERLSRAKDFKEMTIRLKKRKIKRTL